MAAVAAEREALSVLSRAATAYHFPVFQISQPSVRSTRHRRPARTGREYKPFVANTVTFRRCECVWWRCCILSDFIVMLRTLYSQRVMESGRCTSTKKQLIVGWQYNLDYNDSKASYLLLHSPLLPFLKSILPVPSLRKRAFPIL